jgi:TRAP-type uncharacterized transport system substrate-binding protein
MPPTTPPLPAPPTSAGRLARYRALARSRARRILVLVVTITALGVIAARTDFGPTLGRIDVRVLSGPPEGSYRALVDAVVAASAKMGGHVANVESQGSMENLERLARAAKTCDQQFGIVQAGLPFPPGIQVVARLAKSESLVMLGKRADAIVDFAQLGRLRIGVGPEGGGTARVMHGIFDSRDFASLGAVLSYHSFADQLDLAERGELDLAAFVIDEDAELVQRAVRERGLAVAGFPHADVVARQFKFTRKGRIGAGEYDAVRMLPPVDKEVLRIDTLVVTNGCPRRSQIIGLCAALADVFPELPRHNKETPNTTGLEIAPAAKTYWETGPDILDEYLPRIADVMPTSNWVHLVMGLSILFNVMGFGNRFALWRIDVARVRAEHEIADCFGADTTPGDIARMVTHGEVPAGSQARASGGEIERIIGELEALSQRSRKWSLSPLVPMGGEMAYRYQESLIQERLAVLRGYREAARKAQS